MCYDSGRPTGKFVETYKSVVFNKRLADVFCVFSVQFCNTVTTCNANYLAGIREQAFLNCQCLDLPAATVPSFAIPKVCFT